MALSPQDPSISRPTSSSSFFNGPYLSTHLAAATSSTLSIAPSFTDDENPSNPSRRRLLVIYIHGFYGNDESFQSFPAHVHNQLKELLRETHFIHSKIYPRYKTYKAIEVGRDVFCEWLRPHIDDNTDVVLVGHSMGGILAAEVSLKVTTPDPQRTSALENRILGIVALDSPFLGLHHGIILSGISSLFSEAPAMPTPFAKPETNPPSSQPQLHGRTNTSIFNPAYTNDTHMKARSFRESLAHFARKHRPEGLFQATRAHIWNHLEYCSCLLDYPGLYARYNKIRALEDVDELNGSTGAQRVRFVNYYTTCYGRPKTPKMGKRSFEHARGNSLSAGHGSVSDISQPSDALYALDKPARQAAEEAHKAQYKTYKDAMKTYTRACKARDQHQKELQGTSASSSSLSLSSPSSQDAAPRKERKFCVLPKPRDDQTWVKVPMNDVDEVGAHCGLFFPGRHYEALLGDVTIRIAGWVQEEMSKREILRLQNEEH
ncbi:hypothetical protein TD95_004452 [Thielaviopsis punctulata]|uniref:DUF676 domain-containing protein n=1 Tax=Thielaviopsis punctulata TaxID=72032 RepID=A0A0F4ZCQ6_9PEZI|nr:hypothetical protein TD95_004452 [Thielaviopsis punctulata]